VYLEQARNPGEGRNTFTVFTDLQSNDVGLEPGAVFEVDGFLKVSRSGNPHPAGTSGTGTVGTVTVGHWKRPRVSGRVNSTVDKHQVWCGDYTWFHF